MKTKSKRELTELGEARLDEARLKVDKMMTSINEHNRLIFAGPIQFQPGIWLELWHVFGLESAFVIIEYVQVDIDSHPSVHCFLQEHGATWESMEREIRQRIGEQNEG